MQAVLRGGRRHRARRGLCGGDPETTVRRRAGRRPGAGRPPGRRRQLRRPLERPDGTQPGRPTGAAGKGVRAGRARRPAHVDYAEAHGTGTPLGDPIEAGALGAVLGGGRGPDQTLLPASAKGDLGHLESAAGIAGRVQTVPALHRDRGPVPLMDAIELRTGRIGSMVGLWTVNPLWSCSRPRRTADGW
ncbi:hypothetical protein AB0D62_28590 [Streptomyces massasporeus]|uniref:hypothetical protein n=1 Tax=Streptomyces massasporeus TaxID=67324 RepID=UPI0033EF2326